MLFWIPLGVSVAIIIALIIWAVVEEDGEIAAWSLLVVVVFGAFIGISAGVIQTANSDTSALRDRSVTHIKPFADGNYLQMRSIHGSEWVTVNEVLDKQTVPISFNYDQDNLPGSDAYSTSIVYTKDGSTPRVVTKQHYLVNPALWPWPIEGNSEDYIEVPRSSIIQK